MERLRVLDLGVTSGLRSQTVWHAIAETMEPDDPPVLALQRPSEGYVSIGFHRSLAELDLEACSRRELTVYRRRVGGGPVFCDEAQLFFQFIIPVAKAPAVLEQAWKMFMGPAVEAFRGFGADARLSGSNDILVGDRKVSGLGAATIGGAMVFVGNVIFDFDYDAMVDVLALPGERFEAEVGRLMRRYLSPIQEVAGATCLMTGAREGVIAAYAAAFGEPEPSELTGREEAAAAALDETFVSPEWVHAERAPRRTAVKIRSGVGVVDLDGTMVSFVDGRVERVEVSDAWIAAPGMREELERALAGLPLDGEFVARAAAVAPAGAELADAIVRAHRRGI